MVAGVFTGSAWLGGGTATTLEDRMNWIKVNNEDEATLPPLDKIVWIIWLSGYDDGPVWGVLENGRAGFARNWEPKLYGIEAEDDYRVTH